MIRVLVVDDSVVVRRVLTETLESDGDVRVVGTAATASIGLQKIALLGPDVVVLDVEMPEMDGIEAVRRIRASWPTLPVVMCSTLTERGAEATVRALAAGATDCVAKPSSLGGKGDGMSSFRDELTTKVKALRPRAPARVAPVIPLPPPRRIAADRAVTAVGIGCSTGGPNALARLFESLPADLPVPIFIVQHMPPLFTKILAERLSASSRVRVVEAAHGEPVVAGQAYVAPGNYHMVVSREAGDVRIALNQDAQENSCRPAVDVLFRSLAEVYGAGALVAVLTGMGRDGARGASEVVSAGGRVIVQDAESCVVPSMPGAVASLGIAEGAFSLERIGGELVRRVRRAGLRAALGRS